MQKHCFWDTGVWRGRGSWDSCRQVTGAGFRIQTRMSACCGSDPSSQLGLAKKNYDRLTELISKELSLDVGYSPTQGPVYSSAQALVWGLSFQVWHLEPTTVPVAQSFSAALSWGLCPHCLPGSGAQMALARKACLRSREQLLSSCVRESIVHILRLPCCPRGERLRIAISLASFFFNMCKESQKQWN